jgi:hypothetical protein
MGSVPVLFRRLIDDAALFPPGNAPMALAVPGHRAIRTGVHDSLVGPFLCPSSRLEELRDNLLHRKGYVALDLGLIVDTGIESMTDAVGVAAADARLDLRLLEVPVPAGTDLASRARQIIELAPTPDADARTPALFVELPREAGWRGALDVIAAEGRGAKLRTGGLRADLFPSDEELAAFITACAERAVPFKCTAGLHHAVRHTDPATGFRHHGFLNILVGTARAVTADDVVDALAETRPDRIAQAAAALDEETARQTRALFHSYGSCDIAEPVHDLQELGLLAADAAAGPTSANTDAS